MFIDSFCLLLLPLWFCLSGDFVIFLFQGCEVSVEWEPRPYSSLDTNNTLVDLYQANVETLGVTFNPFEEYGKGSTDMGNVSQVVPSFHVIYSIATNTVNHSHEFTAAAITEIAHNKTLIASKGMAMTAIDVLCNPEFLQKIKKDFKKTHPSM